MSAIKSLLEGKPFRAPIHPALVHLPVALLPLSLLLDIASWIFRSPDLHLVRAALLAIIAGIVTGLLAAAFGFVDYTTIRRDHRARKTARQHMLLNVVSLTLFAVSAFLRRDDLDAAQSPILPLLLSIVAAGLLGYSGYLGGHLVYSDGIGVGRHRHRGELPKSTLAANGREATMLDVADSIIVVEGSTIRLDVNGTTMAVARVRGKLYAVQEFCTHRFGPMSEGALEGNDIVCPWHCSHFDITTGKVTAGPAKMDLRTFRVEERDGRIWIERPEAGTSRDPRRADS